MLSAQSLNTRHAIERIRTCPSDNRQLVAQNPPLIDATRRELE